MAIELYPHQKKAIEEMRSGVILDGDVGSGKSITSLAYYFIKECRGSLKINGEGRYDLMETSKDLYVITTALKRDSLDWEAEAVPFGLGNNRDLNQDGVKMTVDSWNNIENYTDVKDAFFIFDEQRLVGSGSWVKAFLAIAKKNNWIVLSATPGDVWMDYVPVFLANGFYKNRTEFVQQHVVYKNFMNFPKIDRYVETGHLEKLRASITVDMPMERHTTRHIKHLKVPYDKELFDMAAVKRWHVYEDRPIRDVSELFTVMRKIVNSDGGRLDAIIELALEHPKLIIFYNYNYELDALRTLAGTTGYPVSEWNGHKHQPVPEGDKWIYLVQYTAGAEGWNCITTDATVFYSLNYSYKINEQAKGRIDRMNTPYTDLYYYILRSGSLIDQAIMRSLMDKRAFNEKKFFKTIFKNNPFTVAKSTPEEDDLEARYAHIKEAA